jgi:hypothetical protein
MRRLDDGKLNGPHPKLFARPSVEAVQVSLLARVFGTSDKDAPVRNDRAAVTRTRECRFPSDVIRRSPMERRFVLLSDTIPTRPAKLRPIPGPPGPPGPHCKGQQQGKRSSLKKYSAIPVQGEAPESDDSSRDCEAKRVHLPLVAGAYSTRQSSESAPSLPLRLSGFFTYSIKLYSRCDGWRRVVLFERGCAAELKSSRRVSVFWVCRVVTPVLSLRGASWKADDPRASRWWSF